MMEEIKACPYCGSDNISITSTWGKYFGTCDGCGANGPEANSYTDAILLWNAAANQLAAKDEEIAEHRRHVATVMQRESEETKAKQYYYDELQKEKTRAAIAIQERDELKAKITRLTEACDDLEGEYLRMKEHSENLLLRINQLTEYKEIWYKRALESLDQRNEARKVARVWYGVAEWWKKKFIMPKSNEPISTRTEHQPAAKTSGSDT